MSIYLSGHQYDKARMVLDYLNQSPPSTYPDNYYMCKAAMHYYYAKRDEAKYEEWYARGRKVARNDAERLVLLGMRAGYYLRGKEDREQDIALGAYQEITRIDPKDAWAWHNMSIIHYKKKQYRQAHDCNQRALKIMDFEAARFVERKINEEWKGRKGLFG